MPTTAAVSQKINNEIMKQNAEDRITSSEVRDVLNDLNNSIDDRHPPLSRASVTLSATNLRNLHNTRIELLPAIPNKYVVPNRIITEGTNGPAMLPDGTDDSTLINIWLSLTSTAGGLFTQELGAPDFFFNGGFAFADTGKTFFSWIKPGNFIDIRSGLQPMQNVTGFEDQALTDGGKQVSIWKNRPLSIVAFSAPDPDTPRTAAQRWADATSALGTFQLKIILDYELIEV